MATITFETWAQIRADYEHTERPIDDICAEHGISSGMLRDRVRRWGWTRRRQPIAPDGPPPLARPAPATTAEPAAAPVLDPPEPAPEEPDAGVQLQAPAGLAGDAVAPAPTAERLNAAIARVLTAIEAIVEKLAGAPSPAREMERAGRTIAALTRTLRELNALLSQYPAQPQADGDELPEDIDAFRNELARRINAFCDAREDAARDGDNPHEM
jgi:hypothetical protein